MDKNNPMSRPRPTEKALKNLVSPIRAGEVDRPRRGGIAAGIANKRRKTIKTAVQLALNGTLPDNLKKQLLEDYGVDYLEICNVAEILVRRQIEKAILERDTRAFLALSEIVEGKPLQQQQIEIKEIDKFQDIRDMSDVALQQALEDASANIKIKPL